MVKHKSKGGNGSVILALLVLVFAFLTIGLIPIIGPIIVGLIAGLISKKFGKFLLAWIMFIMIISIILLGFASSLLSLPLLGPILAILPIGLWVIFGLSSILVFIGGLLGVAINK